MSDSNIISFEEYLRKKDKRITFDKKQFDELQEEIKTRPELIEWLSYQSFFNKYKLFLRSLYLSNHEVGNENYNVGYFLSFENQQTRQHVSEIIEANEWLGRKSVVVDASNCTYRQMVEQVAGYIPKSNKEANQILELELLEKDLVLIITNISKSNLPSKKSHWARSIIKINDDAHFNNITPKSDVLFIDSAIFLERSWKKIGIYLNVFA